MNSYQRAIDEVGHQSRDAHGRRLTIAQIAERMGVRESYLRKAMSAYDDAHPLNAGLIVAITLATGNDALVRYFAEATGHILVALPKVSAQHTDVLDHAGAVAREFGDVMQNAALALADGRVTGDEAVAFRREVTELVTKVMEMAQLMDVKAGIAPPLQVVDRRESA